MLPAKKAPLTSSLLKNRQPARYCVGNGLKMRGAEGANWRVHCAFSAVPALSRTRRSLFNKLLEHCSKQV